FKCRLIYDKPFTSFSSQNTFRFIPFYIYRTREQTVCYSISRNNKMDTKYHPDKVYYLAEDEKYE
ncbi:MAG TPA: hypothetical protein PKI33_14895, partial [Anaerolineales bacterium]|nr:hypothetical protein [Anaerolineales bacterium]